MSTHVQSKESNSLSEMFGKHRELIQRILFLLGALVVYRLGSHIPVPGINPERLKDFFTENQGTILTMFNTFSGGALERMSIMALGIMPYISAAIIIQMMSAVVPSLEALKKEGESGQRKINQYTRQGTLILALVQAIGMSVGLLNGGMTLSSGMSFMLPAVVSLVTGTMFLMWLGEQVTERGIGNGISMLIFASIVATMPAMVQQAGKAIGEGKGLSIFIFIIVLLLTSAFITFFERALRKVPVNYAQRQQQGRKVFAKQQSHLPLKLNMANVIPAIFASSILLVPNTMASLVGSSADPTLTQKILQNFTLLMSPGQPLYLFVYAVMIIFFCYFYTALIFSPKEVAENLKRSGAYVPGIRPGLQTQRYLDHVLNRLTFIGAMYMTAVCLIPMFAERSFTAFYIGSIGTSLLIAIVVLMDFISKLENHLMANKYDNATLIKSNPE